MNESIYILDRIEGPVAVLEEKDGGMVEIPTADLPEGCREGAVLRRLDGVWTAAPQAEADRRAAMQERLRKLLEKNK